MAYNQDNESMETDSLEIVLVQNETNDLPSTSKTHMDKETQVNKNGNVYQLKKGLRHSNRK